jgi:hypothetical protein
VCCNLLWLSSGRFRMQYGCQPSIRKSIWFWGNKLRTAGSLLHVKSPGKTWTSEENVSRIREAFQRSLCKSVWASSLELQIPCSTVHDVLHKRLHLRMYEIQMIRALTPH